MYLGFLTCKEDVFQEFGVPQDEQDCKILFAYYEHEDYGCDGRAFVLLERNQKLYEVNGGHCSCYGLEGQWDPEETSVDALMYRLREGACGYYWHGGNEKQLKGVLQRWKRKQKA